jgi:hypothetical protein
MNINNSILFYLLISLPVLRILIGFRSTKAKMVKTEKKKEMFYLKLGVWSFLLGLFMEA